MDGAAHLLRGGAFKRCRVLPPLTPGKTERSQKAVETRLRGCRPRVRRHQGHGEGGIIEACPHQARRRCIVGKQGSDSRGHIGVHASTTPKERTDGRPFRCGRIVHVAH